MFSVINRSTSLCEDGKILLDFIEDERQAIKIKRQGKFYPSNHYKIKKALAKTESTIPQKLWTELYEHYMRITATLPKATEKNIPHILEAYKNLQPHLTAPFPNMSDRFTMVLYFGCDENGEISTKAAKNHTDIEENRKLVDQLGKYVSLPNQWEKIEKFKTFSDQAQRCHAILRYLNYRCDFKGTTETYDYLNLKFWGTFLVAVINPETRNIVLSEFTHDDLQLPKKQEQFIILARMLEAIDNQLEQKDEKYNQIREKLIRQNEQEKENTESARLAKTLGLDFGDEKEWHITIYIPEKGNEKYPAIKPNLILKLTNSANIGWQISMYPSQKPKYSEFEGKKPHCDIPINALGSGNLEKFPQWLKALKENHDISFDSKNAQISCGRKRSNAKKLQEWLNSA